MNANDLQQRVERIEVDMQDVKEALQNITVQQQRTQQQMDTLIRSQQQTQITVDRLGQRVDAFVFEAQRLITNQAEKTDRTEGQADRHEAIIQRLDRNYREQQSQIAEFRITTGAALERIDRVLDYLMRQEGQR